MVESLQKHQKNRSSEISGMIKSLRYMDQQLSDFVIAYDASLKYVLKCQGCLEALLEDLESKSIVYSDRGGRKNRKG